MQTLLGALLRSCSRSGKPNPHQVLRRAQRIKWNFSLSFSISGIKIKAPRHTTIGLLMGLVLLKAKAEPGDTAPPVLVGLHTVLPLLSDSGVLSFQLSCVAQPARGCSGTRQQLHLPEWRQGLHPAVLLLHLTVHLSRCLDKAEKVRVRGIEKTEQKQEKGKDQGPAM